MSFALIITFIFGGILTAPSDTLTLDYCYSRLENHYPISQKIELQKEITRLNKRIAHTAYYPQMNVGARATYQSEVTEFTMSTPGGQSIGPELSKDHYEISLDVMQPIYNRGAVGIKKNLEEAEGEQELQSVKVQMHQLKHQVNRVYFGILLAQQQTDIIRSVSESLRSQIESVNSRVENGALLPSQLYILEAELIRVQQDSIDIHANIEAGYEVLGQLIGEDLNDTRTLEVPRITYSGNQQESLARLRPEFDLFESNRRYLNHRKELVGTGLMPSISAFGTAAYGRPGFNFFENDLHGYYILGIKMNWNFWTARNANVRKEVINLQKKSVNEEEEAFERQLRASLSEVKKEIQSLESQVERDQKIVELREKVVKVVASQLENGAATATEYITELNKQTQAELSKRMHETRLAQAKVDYRTLLGAEDINQ